ncbi:thioredoxin domain-containing protein [Pseudogracilibacillus sp. SO30301A]|uniref:thioredoxin domain-containing protein n=1 Tax=Pseudogracilibacillus sp. SO30301A TaxID=3098291 RepID=UPI00300E30F0
MVANQNKLIDEKSPYLLQHAHNPVAWYPWGEKAFEKAQSENKPIFLSIGYSTCHWCHVMVHESFEDEEVAEVLNEHYISIKVDREERPDIDSVYMKVCQMMTGHGGWPLTIIMTPDKIPFYAGTYFPKESKHELPGMIEMLTGLYNKYTEDPDHITDVTKSVTEALRESIQEKSNSRLTKMSIQEAFQQLSQKFDNEFGGFGRAPKFPQPQNLLYLLTYNSFYDNSHALEIVETTCKAMAEGGIFDQIGFGFSRYSTDEAWLVPHFEKMLYDNALLLLLYTECYQTTKNPFYKKIATQIIDFISREMTSKEGAFYSAIDADSEGVEGKYYVWKYEEIFDVLGEELGELYATVYHLTPYGNFEGKNIPNLIYNNKKDTAAENELSLEELDFKLENARKKLLEHREKRIYPHVDDKVLTAWNSMMIAALARAGKVFKEIKYIQIAERAIHFIEVKLYKKERLMARYREEETKFKAYLDDYAFLVWAYVELYEATYELEYIQKAKNVTDDMLDLFWDNKHGGFYQTGSDSEQLIAREKEIFDGALPSGNGVAANMLVILSSLTGDTKYLDKCEEMYHTFYEDLHQYTSAGAFFIKSLLLTENPTKEVVIIGSKNDPIRQQLLESLQEEYLPATSLLVAERAEDFTKVAPFAAQYKQLENKTTVYVCENFSCQAPTTNLQEAMSKIKY